LTATVPAIDELLARPLPVRAEFVARALWAGVEQTRRRGAGGEFRELREYHPGDPTSRVDWRASARTDRWLIRETERATHLRVVLILDRTASMRYPVDPRRGASKADLATTLAAGIGVHALRQGHAVALWSDPAARTSPRSGRPAEAELLRRLEEPYDALGPVPPVDQEALAAKADLALLVGDLLDVGAPSALRGLGLVVGRGVTVRAVQLLHRDELEFPFRGAAEFVPLEGEAAAVELDGVTARTAYLENLRRYLAELEAVARQSRVDLLRRTTAADLVETARFLAAGIVP
jgi:uncharacterized protein (DUF58 family)